MSSKKTTLNNEQRIAVLTFKDQNPDKTNIDLANWVKETFDLNIHPTTVGRLIKRKDDITGGPLVKRQRTVQYPDIENALYEWVLRSQDKIPLTDAILTEKAKNFAERLNIPDNNFKFSHGWLCKFKKRHDLARIKKHGEDASSDYDAIATALPELREMLKEYDLKDIYNMDETGLFYRYNLDYNMIIKLLNYTNLYFSLEPDTTLATIRLKGKKKDKERLTVVLCANADGTDKTKPFVIGKSYNPRCFKNVNRTNLGVTYEANKKAWMTGILFEQWIKAFDARMTGRKVILLMDNAPSHIINRDLRNTTIHFLPPNTTARIQPMDAGVIMSFKRHYRNYFTKWLIERYETEIGSNKMDVLTAIKFIVKAWHKVSATTIHNCFQHTGILPVNNNNNGISGDNDDDLIRELQENIQALPLRNKMNISEYIDYPEERDVDEPLTDQEIADLVIGQVENNESEEENEDNNTWRKITHKEAKNAIELLTQYFVQQDLDNAVKLEYDNALFRLSKEVKRLQNASLTQVSLDAYLK